MIAAEKERRARNKIRKFFPEEGPLRRELYPKHMAFFEATAKYSEVLFLSANRVGKTTAGAFAVTCWMTGWYPDWWRGRRFDGPIDAWAGTDTSRTTRDILQHEFLGQPGSWGTGMIPGDAIRSTTAKQGISDAVDTIYVRHLSGGISTLQFKSYDQGRDTWQGTAKHVVLTDEECPIEIYTEALMRTMTTKGIMLATFTPVNGWSQLVQSYMEGDNKGIRLG